MLIIFGALVSLLVQILKNVAKTSEYMTLAIVIGVSLFAAGAYYMLTAFNLWMAFAAILTIAGAIYAFIIARFETEAPNGTNGVLNVSVPVGANAPG